MHTLALLCRHEKLEGRARCFLNETLLQALQTYPIRLHPLVDARYAQEEAKLCDGLLLPGGEDPLPYFHEGCYDAFSKYYEHAEDLQELLVIDAFMQARKPILGICRGMQMLHLYWHGALEVHFDLFVHQQEHRHWITLTKNSLLKQMYPSSITVNSYHHERICKPVSCERVDAVCTDGTIEAFHHASLPVLGVQWHPELMENDRILPYFLKLVLER